MNTMTVYRVPACLPQPCDCAADWEDHDTRDDLPYPQRRFATVQLSYQRDDTSPLAGDLTIERLSAELTLYLSDARLADEELSIGTFARLLHLAIFADAQFENLSATPYTALETRPTMLFYICPECSHEYKRTLGDVIYKTGQEMQP